MLDDEATKNCTFGHYARFLVDIDLSQRLFDDILVEREGFTFYVGVVYEKLPEFCVRCKSIGHSVNACNQLKPKPTAEEDHTKKIRTVKPQSKQTYIVNESKSNLPPPVRDEEVQLTKEGKQLAQAMADQTVNNNPENDDKQPSELLLVRRKQGMRNQLWNGWIILTRRKRLWLLWMIVVRILMMSSQLMSVKIICHKGMHPWVQVSLKLVITWRIVQSRKPPQVWKM
jgi:hypothetical protein